MNPTWRKNYLRYKQYFLNVSGLYKERTDLKIYLEIFLSLATVSLFAVFALRPTLLTIAELIKEIEVKKETLNTMNAKIRDLRGAQTLYDQNVNNIRYVKSAVPLSSSTEIFVRQLEGVALKNKTQIQEIFIDKTVITGPQAPVKDKLSSSETSKIPLPEGANEVAFSVNTATMLIDYQPLYNFLQDVERLRWPVKIDSLTFYTATDDERQIKLFMKIEGRLPYLIFNEVQK